MRNAFACLVHERVECVIDLVANLRCLDPESMVLLYNGGPDPAMLDRVHGLDDQVIVHPVPRRLAWGRLHDFAIDCMRFALDHLDFDTVTIVDSDQLATRRGWSGHLAAFLAARPGVGLLSNAPFRQPRSTRVGPAQAAWREVDLWRPLLRRFPGGEDKFPHWTFWPSTVFTRTAARDLVDLFQDPELQRILGHSQIWATEEVVLPSLVAVLGHDVAANPCSYDYNRFRVPYRVQQIGDALARADVFWLHPVPRSYDDPLRARVRSHFDGYRRRPRRATVEAARDDAPQLLLTLPILERMDAIEGWFSRAEADLLVAATARALATLPPPHHVVEVGSYCGRSTVVLGSVVKAVAPDARVHAIDPHLGIVGAAGAKLHRGRPTFQRFLGNIAAAGVAEVVEPVRKHSFEVDWDQPVSLLLLDGLHDYENVACDLSHFERWLVDGGYLALHDCADAYPGVRALADQLMATGRYAHVRQVESLLVLQRRDGGAGAAPIRPILDCIEGVEGWLERDEATLLALTAAWALRLHGAAAMVEVGSYCGRGTIVLGSVAAAEPAARVYAIDRHDGTVGAADTGLVHGPPTLDRFRRNISGAGLEHVVEAVTAAAADVPWSTKVGLLLVDGLHDYASVAADFRSFAEWILPGGFVAFHDYADYFPGVRVFVDELLRGPEYREVARARSLIVLQREQADQRRERGEKPRRSRRRTATDQPAPATPAHQTGMPLVSCIMPTRDRRRFVPQAIRYFLRQDYDPKELIVVDDGTDPVDDLMPDDPRVRYVRLSGRRSIGAKRNLACEQAAGEVMANWDDDDWMAGWRLRYQVASLIEREADVCGLTTVLFYDSDHGGAWRYTYPDDRRPWLLEGTYCYRRAFWASNPFPDTNHGVDLRYLWRGTHQRVHVLADSSFYVAIIHAGNTSPKRTSDSWWRPRPTEEVAALMGLDWSLYPPAIDGTLTAGGTVRSTLGR